MPAIFIHLIFMVMVVSEVQTADHCVPGTQFGPPKENQTFSFTNPSAKLLSSVFKKSRESCLKKCCNTDSCNIVSFNQSSTVKDENCYLYSCLPLDKCLFQAAVSVLSYVLISEDTDDLNVTPSVQQNDKVETIQPEVDTRDGPEKQEVISEKVVDIINDTDIDLDLLNNGKSSSSLPTLSSLATPVKTTNTLTSSQSSSASKSSSEQQKSTTNSVLLNSGSTTHLTPNPTIKSTLEKTTNLASKLTKNPSSTNTVARNTTLTSHSPRVSAPSKSTLSTASSPSISNTSSTVSSLKSVKSAVANVSNGGTNSSVATKAQLQSENRRPISTVSTNLPSVNKSATHTTKQVNSPIVPAMGNPTSETNMTIMKASNTTHTVIPNATMNTITTVKPTNITTTTKSTTTKTTKTTSTTTKATTKPKVQQQSEATTSSADTTVKIETTSESVTTVLDETEFSNSSAVESTDKSPVLTGDLNITFADSSQLKKEEHESHVLSAALIAALSFGILFFFAVLVLIGKRCFDSWQRRHYSRVDYLVNGMYN